MAKITALVHAQITDARRLFVEQIEAQVQLLQSSAQTPDDAGRRIGSIEWLKTEYNNVVDPGSFYTFGQKNHLRFGRILDGNIENKSQLTRI